MRPLQLVAALFAQLAFAMSVASVKAEQISGSSTAVAGWNIGAYTNDSTGKFSHCAMSAAYRSGITMYFSVSGNYSWRVGWSHPSWQFVKGNEVDIAVHVDDKGPYNLRAVAASNSMALAELPPQSSVFDLMRRGHRMTVFTSGNRYGFNLDGTYAALSEILACAGRYSGVSTATPSVVAPPSFVPNKQSSSRPSEVTAEQRLEATKVIANVLAKGDMADFTLLTAREIADLKSDYLSKSDVVWRADGVLGTLRIIPKSTASTAKDIATAVVADDLRGCKGQSVSGTTKDERNSAVVRMFTGCQDGKDAFEYRYTVVPIEDGTHYLFATVSKSNSGKTSNAAKAEVLLREAVYDVLQK